MLDVVGARMVGKTAVQMPIADQGGGGAWILHWTKHGSPPRLEWRYRAWTSAELLKHSTYLEATNATEVADVILAAKVQDLVMVMDNASWIQDARILSCGAESMIAPLQAFARLLIQYPQARIFMLFNLLNLVLSPPHVLRSQNLHYGTSRASNLRTEQLEGFSKIEHVSEIWMYEIYILYHW